MAIEPPHQSFRQRGSKHVIQIDARFHPKLQQYIILWSDICEAFPNATRIYDDNKFITKMHDSELQ
ncbi:hypothetical protein FBU30_000541, partial [Linnemannia zychae]